jgi:hypothetical protein
VKYLQEEEKFPLGFSFKKNENNVKLLGATAEY